MSNREGHEQEIETKTREKLKDLPDYLNQFYYRMTANGMQATTKRSYIGYCVNFLKYFSPDLSIDPNNITDSDIDKYMDSITYINGKKASVSSRATKLSALKTFFGFMKERGIIERDPTKSIRPPKNKGLNPVVYLTETEIKMVEHTIRTGAGSHKAKAKQKKWRNRDLAIYFLFLSTGMRVEALSEIDVEDIDFHDKKLIVIDKGEKEIIHFLSDQLIEYIQIWLEDREKFLTEKGKEEKALFQNKMKMANCKTMNHFLRKVVSESNIYVVDLQPFREIQGLLSRYANSVNQIAKRVNSTGVIYSDDINDMKQQIEHLSKEIWQIHSLLLDRTTTKGDDT